MPIIHYPGYITKEEVAARKQIQVRSINAHIKKNTIAYIKVDGFYFVKDKTSTVHPPVGINLTKLEWVNRFAKKHKIFSDRIYEQIVIGNITGVVVANRVFVMPEEPALFTFLKIAGKK